MSGSFRTPADGLLPLRVSKRQAVSTSFTGPPTNPSIRLLSVTLIAPCTSISVRKCEHLRFSTLLLTAFARVHTAFFATSGIGSQAALTPDVFRYESPMLNKISCYAYGKSAHTLSLQSSCSSFPFPESPMLCRSASRVVGGLRLPEVLHYAHRSLCLSPPIEHKPTSPISAEAKLHRRTQYWRVGFASHVGALTAHSAFRVGDFRSVCAGRLGGLCRQLRGIAPNPIKGCLTAF